MCLVAAELERQGIATVTLQLLEPLAKKITPPRALYLPFAHGYPLQAPHDAEAQRAVMQHALSMLETATGPPPVTARFSSAAETGGDPRLA